MAFLSVRHGDGGCGAAVAFANPYRYLNLFQAFEFYGRTLVSPRLDSPVLGQMLMLYLRLRPARRRQLKRLDICYLYQLPMLIVHPAAVREHCLDP
jgi:hypothetical protein